LGVAAVISPRRYRAARAARALAELLDEPAVTARARAIGGVVQSEDGVGAACDAIEEAALAPRAPAPGD
ncbi:MAG TPA: glycosyltransferase, partial [Gemmatimonadota bacterium]|nr:glycosyltransferase [Gemmatimonadota bacterium]